MALPNPVSLQQGFPDAPIYLHLTLFCRSAEELKETKMRLVSFCKGYDNPVFAFTGVLLGSTMSDLKIAVNLAFHLETMMCSSEVLATLMSIHALGPSVVVIAERDSARSGGSFLARLVEELNYFTAMFHSLHDCLPAENVERLSIERNHLGEID